jgi:hypothetical protein
MAALVSGHPKSVQTIHTAYLHLVPQLRFALPALPLACIGGPLDAARGAVALASYLTGVHIALALKASALGVVFSRVCHARRRGARNLARSHAACQSLGLLLLQLFQHLLYGNGVEDVLSGSREDGQDGEGAIFLVLFEAAAEADGSVELR